MPQLRTFEEAIFTNVETALKKGYLVPADPERENIGVADGLFGTAGTADMVARAFQYWPESVSDNREVGWQSKEVPGGSHPIYQWVNGGDRVIGFTAHFTTDIDPSKVGIPFPGPGVGIQDIDPERSPNLRAVAKWLRWYTYPSYVTGGRSADPDIRVNPPPKLLLVLPGAQLADDGGDEMLCYMTGCNITYEDFFESGVPRRMSVDLEFTQVVQGTVARDPFFGHATGVQGGVKFIGREDLGVDGEAPLDYEITPEK